eukprot:11836952-Alexandrium_andersonii.AAC.1
MSVCCSWSGAAPASQWCRAVSGSPARRWHLGAGSARGPDAFATGAACAFFCVCAGDAGPRCGRGPAQWRQRPLSRRP